jgi:plasmid stability protein
VGGLSGPERDQSDCIDIDIVRSLAMGQILIRNLDDAVLDALRSRAAERGSSLEEEARQAIAASVGVDRDAILARLEEVSKQIGRLKGPSIVEDLRRDRARDEEL